MKRGVKEGSICAFVSLIVIPMPWHSVVLVSGTNISLSSAGTMARLSNQDRRKMVFCDTQEVFFSSSFVTFTLIELFVSL